MLMGHSATSPLIPLTAAPSRVICSSFFSSPYRSCHKPHFLPAALCRASSTVSQCSCPPQKNHALALTAQVRICSGILLSLLSKPKHCFQCSEITASIAFALWQTDLLTKTSPFVFMVHPSEADDSLTLMFSVIFSLLPSSIRKPLTHWRERYLCTHRCRKLNQ